MRLYILYAFTYTYKCEYLGGGVGEESQSANVRCSVVCLSLIGTWLAALWSFLSVATCLERLELAFLCV